MCKGAQAQGMRPANKLPLIRVTTPSFPTYPQSHFSGPPGSFGSNCQPDFPDEMAAEKGDWRKNNNNKAAESAGVILGAILKTLKEKNQYLMLEIAKTHYFVVKRFSLLSCLC